MNAVIVAKLSGNALRKAVLEVSTYECAALIYGSIVTREDVLYFNIPVNSTIDL